ncbi:MAG: lauroyl acyltransferase [Rhodospirillaceae bacterium]|nr:lauroyl acyltransferase [Rhodospirillaceae bacterium]
MKQTNQPKHSNAKWHKRFITWPLEGLAAWVLVNTLKLIPIDTASNLTGNIARRLGPCLPVSNRARNNLQNCFPNWTKNYIETVLSDMWENCGRIIGEYPHIQELDVSGNDKRIKVDGIEHIKSMRDDNAPGIVFSAHLGNWELLPMLAQPNGLEMNFVYRALNSPTAEKVLRKTRNKLSPYLIPKSREGAIKMASVLKQGGHLAIMIDQKLNEGIEIPFFGKPAKTTTALAAFALRHRCPIVPARVERLSGANFRVTFYPPIEIPDSGDIAKDTESIMIKANGIIENWIRETPSQWLWLHRRWGK